MSYILKALRLSEEERAKGDVPRLTTRHRRGSKPRRKVWPWVMVAVLAVNLLLVFLALWPNQISSPTNGMELDRNALPRAEGPLENPPLNGQDMASVAGSEQLDLDPRLEDLHGGRSDDFGGNLDVTASVHSGASEVQEARLTDRANLNWLESEDDATPPPYPSSEPTKQEVVAPPPSPTQRNLDEADFTQQALLDWAEDEILGEEEVVRFAEEPSAELAIAEETITEEAGVGGPLQVARVEATEALPEENEATIPVVDLYGDVPELWALPHEIRGSIPDVALTVHVYAPEDASRFVIINRKRYREGDVVNGLVRLEAIIPSGVVLDYDGYRFRVGSQ